MNFIAVRFDCLGQSSSAAVSKHCTNVQNYTDIYTYMYVHIYVYIYNIKLAGGESIDKTEERKG